MIEIPKQLQNENFRFILLNSKSKLPLENAWTLLEEEYTKQADGSWKNKLTGELYTITEKTVNGDKIEKPYIGEIHNYKYNDIKLLNWLNNDGNYGVLLGPGNLRVLDADDVEFAKKCIEQIKTFTIRTCGGGYHFYFISNYDKTINFKGGEWKARDVQVVGPNCYAIDEKKKHEGFYTIIE